MDKKKITGHQLMAMTVGFVCGASTLIFASSTTSLARQDAWISALVAMLAGLYIIWANTYLGGLFPDKTFVEVNQLLLGKWLGGLTAAYYIFLCFIGEVQYVWYVGDYFTTQHMPETPPYVIYILFSIAVVIALLYGMEAMARASEIFYYSIVSMFILSMVLVAPNVDINNILPVLENGPVPVLKGSLSLISFTMIAIIIMNMIYPVHVADVKDAKKSMFKGYLKAMAIVFTSVMMCNLVMGHTVTASARFPVFLLTKEINVGIIFTRLEALIVIVWLFTIFINTVIFFYPVALGIAQLLKLKDHKKLVLPLWLITIVFSEFIYHDDLYEIKWDTEVWLPYSITVGLMLPLLLLLVYFIKKHIFKMDMHGK